MTSRSESWKIDFSGRASGEALRPTRSARRGDKSKELQGETGRGHEIKLAGDRRPGQATILTSEKAAERAARKRSRPWKQRVAAFPHELNQGRKAAKRPSLGMSLSLAARVPLEADQRVFYAELLLFEIMDDVVIRVGSALFGSNFGVEVCMLDLEGLKMWLCVHSQLSRLEVAVGRCLRRWDV
jgi:hypothetical protein